jgi:leucyl aminopeptidase
VRVTLYTDELREAPTDLIAIGIFSDEPDRGLAFSDLNRALEGALERACREEEFKGNPGQTLLFNAGGQIPAKRILVFGFGERDTFSPETLRRFGGQMSRTAQKVGARSATIQLTIPYESEAPENVVELIRALTEGAELGAYSYDEFRTREVKVPSLKELRVAFQAEDVRGLKGADLRAALVRGQNVAAGVAIARDLVNAPPNVLSPLELADRARRIAKGDELQVKILNARDLERQGMNLHLGVGRGSKNEPRLIHLTYQPPDVEKDARVVALVGKGITFDAGGLSLKTSEGMMEMKVDMGGGAAVIGAMHSVSLIKPRCIVHGIIGAAENMPDGGAIRPGDILRSKKGLTVEVLNTDAEGRLVLADVLAYAQELKPAEVVDLATLTGACMVALGRGVAGAFINDDELASRLETAWKRSGERFWRMPLEPELRDQIKSDVADLKNVGERYGGAITAALFLQEFIEPGVKWAHLDIAGPVLAQKENAYVPKGATGFGVRTLVEFICDGK